MNIFFLDWNPQIAAQYHNDKHVIKMILEYAQMLSTTHRVLDGECISYINENGRNRKYWQLDTYVLQVNLYKATHVNHKCNVWVRESAGNYQWLYNLYNALCSEFEYRRGKIHKTSELTGLLEWLPKNIPEGKITKPPLAMPDQYKTNNIIESYRNYYINEKSYFSTWQKRDKPEWWQSSELVH